MPNGPPCYLKRFDPHLDKAQLDEEWTTNGKEAIWVGRSDQIFQGHIVVPIEWDPSSKIYKLHPTVHVMKQAGTLGAAVAPDRGPIHRHGQRGGKGWQ